MPFPPDRPIDILEQQYPAYPLPPLNALCYTFVLHTTDIRWTSPTELSANTKFNIVGVNIYRSFDSEFGPYTRLNALPIGSTFYRDKLLQHVVIDEVANIVANGNTDPDGQWIIQAQNKPLVIDLATAPHPNCTNLNVQVMIDGQLACVESINANTGEIVLCRTPTFDVASQTQTAAILPTANGGPGGGPSVVTVTYKYVAQDELPSDLDQKIFYRLTTVALDRTTGNLIETPLDRATLCNNREGEKLDWIWREAVRRNKWMLEQAGERVKVFIQKRVGPRCGCYNYSNQQPQADCLTCYGTSIIGGYDGPFDVVMSPEDGERSIAQSNRGRTIAHPYDTWTGPSPLLSQRDFFVKHNGDRYGIGPVRGPTNRGMILQQFFAASHLDSTDIRYKVPLPDPFYMVFPQTRYTIPGRGDATPMMTQRDSIPDERQIRGNTVVFENELRK